MFANNNSQQIPTSTCVPWFPEAFTSSWNRFRP